MRLTETATGCRLDDNPGPEWLLALLFAGVGGAFVVLPYVSHETVDPLLGALGQAMGFAGVGAGLWLASGSPRTRVTIDRSSGRLTLMRQLLWWSERHDLAFDAITDVIIEETPDIDGDPCWRLSLTLATGDRLPLSRLYRHDREASLHLQQRLRDLTATPSTPAA